MSLRFLPAKMSRVVPGTIAVLIFGIAAGGSRCCRADDLHSAYEQAVSTSPAIARARAELDAALAGKPLARSALLPHLQAYASGGMNTAKVSGLGAQTLSTGYHSDVFSASLTESIFDGQARVAMAQSDSRIAASRAALAWAQQSIAMAVVQAYFGVLRARADEAVAQREAELLENIRKETQARLHAGMGDIIAVREVQAQLDAAKAELIAAHNDVAVSKSRLEELTHHAVGTLRDVGEFEARGPEPPTADAWIAAALRNQPLLEQAADEMKVADQQSAYQRRARWPTLTLSGIGQHSAGALIPPVTVDQIGASLNLSIPIYQGGRMRAGTRQAEALARASRANVAATRDQIRVDTQIAFFDLENSVARLNAAEAAVNSARTSLEATRKGYEIGSRSMIDLLTATTQMASAERTFALARYTQLVARVQLKAAAGVLSPQDIESINTLLTGPER